MTGLSIKCVREAFRGGSPVGLQLGLDASNVAIGGQSQQQMNAVYVRSMVMLNRAGGHVVKYEDGTGEAPTGPIVARLGEA